VTAERNTKQIAIRLRRDVLVTLSLILLLGGALLGAWLARAAPIDPAWSRGLLRLDGLAACFSVLTITLTLAIGPYSPRATSGAQVSVLGSRFSVLRSPATCLLLCIAYLTTHLVFLSGALLLAAIINGLRRWEHWTAALLASAGLALIALRAGTWRYPAPDAGLGLNSLSFGLLLSAVVLASGALGLIVPRTARLSPLLAVGLMYTLYRLFSLGPWNLGWQLAALLLGVTVTLGAGWQAALRADRSLPDRLVTLQCGMALIGAGLASGAGLALGAYALLALALQQAAFQRTEGGRWLWLVSGAVPLTVPFVAGWIGIAGAMAGGVTALALAIWAGLLLAAAGVARLAEVEREDTWAAGQKDEPPDRSAIGYRLSAFLSLVLGSATPPVFALLIQPMVAQLQGGLTPFGEVTLWPWAGLLALNAARQPVATLPSLALAALMLILAALAWLMTRLIGLRGSGKTGEP
jgi:hypothetical protein